MLASGYKVRIAKKRGAMPDVQLLTERTYRVANDAGLASGRPEVAVEIVSPRSRAHDRVRKVAWYESRGVPEYWLVDPKRRTFERRVLRRGKYVVAEQLTADVTFSPDRFPGLHIPLAELWNALVSPRRRRRVVRGASARLTASRSRGTGRRRRRPPPA